MKAWLPLSMLLVGITISYAVTQEQTAAIYGIPDALTLDEREVEHELERGRREAKVSCKASLDKLTVSVSSLKVSNTNNYQYTQVTNNIGVSSTSFKNSIDTVSDTQTLNSLSGAFASASTSITKFASDDPLEVASGALDLVVSFAPILGSLGGPIGAAIGTGISIVASIVNGILGLFGMSSPEPPSMDEVVKKIIETALSEERKRKYENEADGLKQVFKVSAAYLRGVREANKDLTKCDVASISANVPIYQGVEFMGTLVGEMRRICRQEHNIDHPPKAATLMAGALECLEYAKLYGMLSIMQDMLLFDLYTTVERSGANRAIASGILAVQADRLKSVGENLAFLREPETSQIIPVALYQSNMHEQLETLMNYAGVPTLEDQSWFADNAMSLRPVKWPNHYACYKSKEIRERVRLLKYIRYNILVGRGCVGPEGRNGQYSFSRDGEVYWFLKNNDPQKYLSATGEYDKFRGANNPNDHGQDYGSLNFIRIKSTGGDCCRYVINIKKWPHQFLYMTQHGDVALRRWNGYPGTGGVWHVKAGANDGY